MKIAIDISMYPLNESYEQPILAFIERLKTYEDVAVVTNKLSTQVFGEYGQVFGLLKTEMETAFTSNSKVVMVVKFINADLA